MNIGGGGGVDHEQYSFISRGISIVSNKIIEEDFDEDYDEEEDDFDQDEDFDEDDEDEYDEFDCDVGDEPTGPVHTL